MAELPEVTPDYFEIVALRELRKVGLEVTETRIHRRAELPEPERGFILQLTARLRRPGWDKRALIGCRRQEAPIGADPVQSLTERLADARAEVAILFSTTEFAPEALAAAREHGVALIRLVEARAAYDASGWGAPGQYPTWLPAYLAQAAERDPAGLVRYRLLEAGQADLIVGQLRPKEATHG